MRIRLFLAFFLVVLISITSFTFIARQNTQQAVNTFMFQGGMAGVDQIAQALENYYQQHGTWNGAEQIIPQPMHGPGSGMMQGMGGMMNQHLRLADAQGNILVDNQSTTNPPVPQTQLSPAEISQAVPLTVNNQVVGYLMPEGGGNFGPGDQINLLNRLNRAALTAGLVSGALSLLLAILLAYTILSPVRELDRAARSLASGRLDQRVRATGNDELATLGKSFNVMAESLQKAEESRRAMTADIAHELRTPLAVQRAHLEAIQDGIYAPTAENLQPILEQNLLLTRLVDDLRTLALADAGQLSLERTQVDLTGLLLQVLGRFEPQAASQNVDLEFDGSSNRVNVLADSQRLEQIFNNLFANALRYTPEGGKINVRLETTFEGVRVILHDSGPGIPSEALPFIFDRFYRADRARAREAGGSGLGLAIARQLAEAHGGSLTAENHPQGGAQFVLTLKQVVLAKYPEGEGRKA